MLIALAGHIAISHNTISRKHITITISPVLPDGALSLSSRSQPTIEDLGSKTGTYVDGQKIEKNGKQAIQKDEAEIVLGKCPAKFRLKFEPVVFTFSLTSKEIQKNPIESLKERFEQMDIKLLTEYQTKWSTHVISKKRNTAKGLQALINAKPIVNESFLDAVVQAAEVQGDGPSELEDNFTAAWPHEFDHLPPKGGEPVDHPDEIYKPDPGRANIFEGYTFIFYDKGQFNNLLAPITNGGGKALFEEVNPDETQVDDFIRYVKAAAGEKGLGEFEDGSEGKGVVLVRFVPAKGTQIPWYTDFFTNVSLRLDHRPIEQSEFLEAILIKDASILRRSLEIESTQDARPAHEERQTVLSAQQEPAPEVHEAAEPQPAPRRRGRRSIKQRFKGFIEDDEDMNDVPPLESAPEPEVGSPQDEESGLFVSQEASQPRESAQQPKSQRKRPLPQEDDLMEGMTTAAERFKRQRLEHGSTFASPSPEPEPQAAAAQAPKRKQKKKEIDVMAQMAQNRQQEEERARQEKEDLAKLPEDVDLSEIRRLNIVEVMEVRRPDTHERTRDQDVADGRWNPKWNGMKNFKKFRRRGENAGRQPAKTIVPLQETKPKEYGVGDDYWLEDGESQRRRQAQSQSQAAESQPEPPRSRTRVQRTIGSDSEEGIGNENGMAVDDKISQIQSGTAVGAKGSQASRQSSQGKRPAPEAPARQSAPKRQRPARRRVEAQESDDSDDDMKFAFGRRR